MGPVTVLLTTLVIAGTITLVFSETVEQEGVRLIVGFKEGSSEAARTRHGGLTRSLGSGVGADIELLELRAPLEPEELDAVLAEINADEEVEFVELDRRVFLDSNDDDDRGAESSSSGSSDLYDPNVMWSLERAKAPKAWEDLRRRETDDVVVCVIDSG
jgi:hypothetical protein